MTNIIPFIHPSERKELSERELQELQEALQNSEQSGWWYQARYYD